MVSSTHPGSHSHILGFHTDDTHPKFSSTLAKISHTHSRLSSIQPRFNMPIPLSFNHPVSHNHPRVSHTHPTLHLPVQDFLHSSQGFPPSPSLHSKLNTLCQDSTGITQHSITVLQCTSLSSPVRCKPWSSMFVNLLLHSPAQTLGGTISVRFLRM